MTNQSSRMRLGVLGIAAVSLFGALFVRLWYLQVITSHELRLAASSNRVRTVLVEAPRGRILDRNGVVIVDNKPSLDVTVDWQAFTRLAPGARDQLLDRLATELTRAGPVPVTVAEVARRIDDARFSHFRPVPIAENVAEQTAIVLAEHQDDFPTVSATRVMVRSYPQGALMAHVLGYVGGLSDTQWTALRAHPDRAKPYSQNDQVGKAGVEASMESYLRGVPGRIHYEVDARNRTIRELDRTDPVRGDDLYLTVDLKLQALTEESLQAGLLRARLTPTKTGPAPAPAGASVVLDPRNSQILAMASYPTFSPLDFTNGVTSARYQQLTAKDAFAPLTNRALQGTYAPGSTFKLATAYAGLALSMIAPQDRISDPGFYDIPGCGAASCRKFNAGRSANGSVDLQRAITVSSDVYFYKLGFDIWAARDRLASPTALQNAMRDFGFGDKTGVELPGEDRGRVPTPAWKREFDRALHGRSTAAGRWQAGDNLNIAVGQGDVLATPLQLANAYAAFANGGTLRHASLVLKVTATGQPAQVRPWFPAPAVRTIQFPPGGYDAMLSGFAGVTADPGGTATSAFNGFPAGFRVAGKTGTAQVGIDPVTHLPRTDNSLFVGFGPVSDPQYVALTVVEGGGFGSAAAAPVVRNILQPIAANAVPAVPPGGAFDPVEVLKQQQNGQGGGPND